MIRKPLLQCLRDPEKRANINRLETGTTVPGISSAGKVNSGNYGVGDVSPRPDSEWFRNRPFWRLRKTSWAPSTYKTMESTKDCWTCLVCFLG